MSKQTLLSSPFADKAMLEDLEKTRVMEIAPEVWELEGYSAPQYFIKPPSCNIFIIRDRDTVLIMDTGEHGFYRERILKILRKFKQEGAKELTLILSHGHHDHGRNNDVIYEAGYKKTRFLLPEPEFHVLDIPNYIIDQERKLLEYYDHYYGRQGALEGIRNWAKQFPAYANPQYQNAWKIIESLPLKYDQEKNRTAWEAVAKEVLFSDLSSYCRDKAELLPLASREKRTFGDVEVLGWMIRRFFFIHDGSQSPGHVSLYDSKYKLMITGDATLELNPVLFDSSLNSCIDICEKCLRMAEQGYIELATDGHRTSQWWGRTLQAWGLEPLDRMVLLDAARGKEECIDFYRFWRDYYSTIKEEVLRSHSRIGEASIQEILDELRKSDNRYVRFKLALSMPRAPASPELWVAKVLAESGAVRLAKGNRILFRPVERKRA
jgi:glyoxylase-like metal-dependent hydrolase (beta-lactamase superfamily II)